MRFAVASLFVLAVALPRAHAQLATAELFVNIHAGTNATDDTPASDPEAFDLGPTTTNAFLGSGSFPWLLQSVVTDAKATSQGQVDWLATATQLRLAGTFHNDIESAPPSAALGGFDAIIKLTFTVSEQTPFSIAGGVSTGRALSDAEVVACQINGTVLAGDSRATPLPAGDYPIVYESVLHPGESMSLECAARSDGGSNDASTVGFDATLTFGDGGGPGTTTTTTLQPLTRKQCKKSCRRAASTCRGACRTLDKTARRTCRRDCKQRGRGCSQSSGCVLPATV